MSLYDLFEQIISLYKDAVVTFELEKLKKKCGVDKNNRGIVVAETKAYNDLRFYRAEDLPHLKIDPPSGVTKIEYDVDCSNAPTLSVDELISRFA